MNIKKERTRCKLSQDKVCGRIGVTRPTLEKIENGEAKLNNEQIEKIKFLFWFFDKKKGVTSAIPEVVSLILYTLSKHGSRVGFDVVDLFDAVCFSLKGVGYPHCKSAIRFMEMKNMIVMVDMLKKHGLIKYMPCVNSNLDGLMASKLIGVDTFMAENIRFN